MAKKDTTPEGVSQEDSAETPESFTDDTNPRREGMAEIVKSARASREQELTEQDESDGERERAENIAASQEETPEEVPEADPEGDPEADPEGQPEGEAQQAAEPTVSVQMPDGSYQDIPLSKVKTRAKVNGQEQEVDGPTLLKGYQMTSAGQARLREANERARALQAREREIEEREKSLTTQARRPEGEQAAPEQDSAFSQEEMAKIAHDLQFGDEQESTKAIERLWSRAKEEAGRTTEGPTQQQIYNSVLEQVQEKTAYDGALRAFAEKYPHIAKDRQVALQATDFVHQIRASNLQEIGYDVGQMTVQQVDQVHAAEARRGTVPGFEQTFMQAGDLTDRYFEEQARARGYVQTAGVSEDFRTKQETKRDTPQQPKGASTRAGATPSKPKLKTGASPSERVAWLAAQRGQSPG